MTREQAEIVVENQVMIMQSLAVLHSRAPEEKEIAAILSERADICLLYLARWQQQK